MTVRKNWKRAASMSAFVGLAVSSLAGQAALAQDVKPDAGFVPEELAKAVVAQTEAEEDYGWDYLLRAGLQGTFVGSSNVIGAVDGNTWTLGASGHHGAYYITRNREWHNDTRFQGAFARTPVLEEWVKSADELDFLSLYLYRLPDIRWVGPFGRFRFRTQVFPSADVRPEVVTYSISRVDGTSQQVLADRLHLTDAFSPLTLRQTVGAFIKPETPAAARFEALVGLGARQTFADGQLVVTGAGAAPVVEITELRSFYQAGTEVALSLTGVIDEGRLTYKFSAEMMTPFLNDLPDDDTRTAVELTNMELKATVSLRPLAWLSIDYQLSALREPQLLDEFQITNRLLVGISYTLIDRRAVPE